MQAAAAATPTVVNGTTTTCTQSNYFTPSPPRKNSAGVGTAAASQVDHQRVIPVPADRRPTRRGVGAGDAGSELLHSVECQHAQASGPE